MTDTENALDVKDINWELWQPEKHAVITYIFSGDKVLLIHKKRGLGAGKVNAPGGHIEPGETEYITFGLMFDCYENGPNKTAKYDLDTIFMTFRLLFNNKQEHVFRRAILISSN